MANTETRHDRAAFVHDSVGGHLTVRIRGEIDHHTAVSIRRDIDALICERRPTHLVLDLSAVSFMDSSGLGLIMGRLALVRERGGELSVWNPAPEVRGILTLAGMERMVRIDYPPATEASGAQAPDQRPGLRSDHRSDRESAREDDSRPAPPPRRRRQPTRRGNTRKEKDA